MRVIQILVRIDIRGELTGRQEEHIVPVSLASRNADSSLDVPEEINPHNHPSPH